jgi:uncharacterized membrane protein
VFQKIPRMDKMSTFQKALLFCCFVAFINSVASFRVQPSVMKHSSRQILRMAEGTESGSPMELSLKKLTSKLLPAAIGASLFLNVPNADAIPSGSRSGGSSFRSAPSSTRMYSSRSYSSGPSVSISPVMPLYTPMYSPFGFGFSPFGFGGFGIMPINLNLLILGGIAYAVYTALSNRAGGSSFDGGEDAGVLGGGATVMKIQVALDSNWSDRNNIMNTLSNIAAKNGAMSTRRDLSRLLSEASLAILRKENEWNAAAYEGELYGGSGRRAEPAFQQLAIKERAKFEEETSPVATIAPSSVGSTPTQAVVSIVVALRGRSSGYISGNVRSMSDVARCLQGLATDALTDDGENIMAVEVLWTPSEPGNTITPRQLIEDYPELIRL